MKKNQHAISLVVVVWVIASTAGAVDLSIDPVEVINRNTATLLGRINSSRYSCPNIPPKAPVFPKEPISSVLVNYCKSNKGELVTSWVCPQTGEVKKGLYCIVQNHRKEKLITNGCSKVTGQYADLFFNACVLHDFCYHSEPKFSGRTKDDCDLALLLDFDRICETQKDIIQCQAIAYSFYSVVQVLGEKAWGCSANGTAYPKTLKDSL